MYWNFKNDEGFGQEKQTFFDTFSLKILIEIRILN